MTLPSNPPDRGFTNPQRLLPESGNVEDVRRALNRVYDQLDRVNVDQNALRQSTTTTINPTPPGGSVGITGGTTNTSTGTTTGGGTATGGGTTGGTGGNIRVPTTFYVPSNNSGVLNIDSDGYVAMQSITV